MINDKKKFNWKTLPELFFEEAKKQLDKPLLWYKINNQYKSKIEFNFYGPKTDKLDAQLIAHYGEAIQPNLSQLKPEAMQAMSDLVARRNQLLVMQTR